MSVSVCRTVAVFSSWRVPVSSTSWRRPYEAKIASAISLSFLFGQASCLSSRSISAVASVPESSSCALPSSLSVTSTWVT